MKVLAPDTKTYTKEDINNLSMKKVFALLDDLDISNNNLYQQYLARHKYAKSKSYSKGRSRSKSKSKKQKIYLLKPTYYYPNLVRQSSVARFPRVYRPPVHFPLPVPPKPRVHFPIPAAPKPSYGRLELSPKPSYSRLDLSPLPKITYSRLGPDAVENKF